MQSKLSAVRDMLDYLVNNNTFETYTIKEHVIPEDEWEAKLTNEESRTSVIVNGLDLPLYSAYWYLQGIVDAQDLGKIS